MAIGSEASGRSRPWLRFSLRAALLVVTIICLVLGSYVKQVLDQKRATEIVRSWGGTVLLEYQWEYETTHKNATNKSPPEPPNFRSFREWFGEDYFSNVVAVSLPYHSSPSIDVPVLLGF